MASNILATYSPEDVTILLGGVVQISGFVDGTFISISKDSPMYTTKESADGTITRTYKKSMLYNVNLILANTSDSNQTLTYTSGLDTLTQMGKFPLIIKDQLGGTLLFSLTSWIENFPDSDFSTGIEGRSWEIKCSQAVFNLGGNGTPSGLGGDILNTGFGLAAGFL